MIAAPLINRISCKLLTISCGIFIRELIRNKHTTVNNITEIKFDTLTKSTYFKPFRVTYKQNGKEKFCDLVDRHNSVAIILYNTTRNVFIFVRQFRPGVYHVNIPLEVRHKPIDMAKYPAELGVTTELCAGLIDKDKSILQIAKEEVLEECGYDVPLENFERVHAIKYENANMGMAGTVMQMYYCEITDSMKVSKGGGVDNEMIEVVEMTLEECERFSSQSYIRSPGSVLIAYYWFKINKPQYCKSLIK